MKNDQTSHPLYKQRIMELYQEKSHNYALADATVTATQTNPLCGDTVTIYCIIIEEKIEKIRFTASGCVLSQASAAFVCKELEGKKIQDKEKLSPSYMQESLGLNLGPTRVLCIMLAIECLKKLATAQKPESL
jgi:nitrogen fixation NifU-like protein